MLMDDGRGYGRTAGQTTRKHDVLRLLLLVGEGIYKLLITVISLEPTHIPNFVSLQSLQLYPTVSQIPDELVGSGVG